MKDDLLALAAECEKAEGPDRELDARLLLGRWEDHAARLAEADAIVTDPPYGIGYRVNARGVCGAEGLKGTAGLATDARPAIAGDDQPFDPAPWLDFPAVAFCGANHFADKLPSSGRWIVWDKRCGSKQDSHSDGELVWCSGKRGALRIHRQKWRGIVREGEENLSRSRKLHQNQKPVALMTTILQTLGLKPGQLVADPFMGSGSTGVAALRMGFRFIGCEMDHAHYQTAVERFAREAALRARAAGHGEG